MSDKRLLLHIGVAKTGSSLLQTAFARLADGALAEQRIHYPAIAEVDDAAKGKPTSGNGLYLAKWLSESLQVPGFPAGWEPGSLFARRQIPRKTETLLLSSEFLMGFQPPRFEQLLRIAADHGFRVELVVYLRSVAGHALSSYSQHVKRARYYEDFVHFVREDYTNRFLAVARKLGRFTPDVKVYAFNYDKHAPRLAAQFFEDCLGLPLPEDFDTSQSINRSLSQCEMEIIREINRVGVGGKSGSQICRTISDYFVEQYPDLTSDRTIPRAALEVLRRNYEKDVEAVNQFLPDGEEIDFVSPDLDVADTAGPVLSEAERAIVSVLGLTLKLGR